MNKTKSLAQISSNMPIFKCRNWYLHTTERRIIKDGDFLEITPKSFDILQLLIERKGETVTKDEILGQVWNGSFVEESNLPVHISKLRRNLGETKTEPIIETAQGIGYRFIAPLKIVDEEEWERLFESQEINQQNEILKDSILDSIAVLPIINESSSLDFDYIADGITENFINQLSHISNLRVIARNTVFGLKNSKTKFKILSERLKISLALTGRIRTIKSQSSLTVEITNLKNETQIWGNFYNFNTDNISLMQEKIISDVIFQIKNLCSPYLNAIYQFKITNNSESYRLYLKGRYLKEKRTFEQLNKAIVCFEESLTFDPTNVYSYVELLETYFSLYISDFIRLDQALSLITPLISTISELGQSVDIVHSAFGGKTFYFDWDFIESEKHFRKSLEINPNCLSARYRYADLLISVGKNSDALKEIKKIINIDPLSTITYKHLGKFFYRMKRYQNAIKYLKDAIELDTNDYIALAIFGACKVEQGEYSLAIEYFSKSLKIQYHLETFSMIGYCYALQGFKEKASVIIETIEKNTEVNRYAIKIARIYSALNDKNKAFYYLNLAFKERDPDLVTLNTDPRFENLKEDHRYNNFLSIIGLPQ